MSDTSKVEMILSVRQPHVNGVGIVSSTERIDDALAVQLAEIADYTTRTPGELLTHAFKVWLSTPEGQRVTAIIEGKKDIERGDIHDMDTVIAELEAILRGDDRGDDG